MNNYIPADKLIAEIESRMEDCKLPDGIFPTKTSVVRYEELSCLRNFIASLQQEQPEFPTTDEEIEKALASIPKVELPDKYKTPDWLFKQQEQPEVDLEKEIQSFWSANALEYRLGHVADINFLTYTARHFFGLGLNARKED